MMQKAKLESIIGMNVKGDFMSEEQDMVDFVEQLVNSGLCKVFVIDEEGMFEIQKSEDAEAGEEKNDEC